MNSDTVMLVVLTSAVTVAMMLLVQAGVSAFESWRRYREEAREARVWTDSVALHWGVRREPGETNAELRARVEEHARAQGRYPSAAE